MFEQAFRNIDDVLRKEAGCTTELDYTEQSSWLLFLKYLDGLEQDKATEAELDGKKYCHIIDKPYRWETWAAPKGQDGQLDHNKALTGDDLRDFVNNKLFPYLHGFKQRATGPDTIEYKIGEIFGEIKNKIQSGYNLREIIDHIDELRFRSQSEKHELSHLYEAKIKNMGNAGRNGGEYYTPRPLIRAIIQVVQPKIGEKIYDGACGSAGFLCESFVYLTSKGKLTTKDLDTLQTRTFYGKEKKSLAYVIAIMNMILHGIEAPNVIHTNTLTENLADIQEKNRYDVVLANPPFGGKERPEVQQNFPIRTGETAFLFLQHFIKILKAGGRGGIVIKNTFLSNTDNASVSLRKLLLESCTLHTVLDWGVVEGSRIRREYPISPGRIEGHGKRGKPLTADYVLEYRNTKLAANEAKAWDEELTEGVAQAKNYAAKLAVRYTYSTNGRGIYAIDMETGKEGEVSAYPTPDELWKMTFARADAWRDRFAEVPFEDKGGSHPSRYYQDIAVQRVMQAIADDKKRILLTLATGTGKTFIAFQIAWKLFHARWNLSREATRRPRILFLADRNILANQAYNAFSAFPEDALVRIAPDDIRKKGKVPKNGSLFFTIFQTFMSGPPKDGKPSPYFGEYPPDFFVIDECHRGGANDESNWRGILDYFVPAVQLGLTATPKRKDNVDTYAYFGEPVYIYSLKEGINDGFLTPFRVKQIQTTLDYYVYTPDDKVVEGEIEAGKLYDEPDFNRSIEIREREKKRVQIFMEQINQGEKTLVFCANQAHALLVRDLINQVKTSKDPNYCQRVTADDGALGEQHLRDFQDNEKSIPTILTTSQKLSTGVDARNIRNIVLMRPINSMIEFKQIIGRGTRLYDGKDYFTIYDFVKAHLHFSDPEWDGEPVEDEACPKCGSRPCVCEVTPPNPCPVCGKTPCECPKEPCPNCGQRPCICKKKVKVRLADGKERNIQHMTATTFWHPDGTPMSAQQFMEMLFGKLPEFFQSEEELRKLWSAPDTRAKLLQGLAGKGFGHDQLAEMQKIIDAGKSDLFDVLAHVAYAMPPLTREVRAANAKVYINSQFNTKQQAFLDFVLSHYVSVGVEELDQNKLTPLLRLKYHDSLADAVTDLGKPDEIGKVFTGFQKYLYARQPA